MKSEDKLREQEAVEAEEMRQIEFERHLRLIDELSARLKNLDAQARELQGSINVLEMSRDAVRELVESPRYRDLYDEHTRKLAMSAMDNGQLLRKAKALVDETKGK
jgi:predicted ATP-dependent protease